jgi:hypothetical protein
VEEEEEEEEEVQNQEEEDEEDGLCEHEEKKEDEAGIARKTAGIYPPGTHVVIKGLMQRSDLNGQEAVILEWCQDAERFVCSLVGDREETGVNAHENLRVRVHNLVVLQAEPEAREEHEKQKQPSQVAHVQVKTHKERMQFKIREAIQAAMKRKISQEGARSTLHAETQGDVPSEQARPDVQGSASYAEFDMPIDALVLPASLPLPAQAGLCPILQATQSFLGHDGDLPFNLIGGAAEEDYRTDAAAAAAAAGDKQNKKKRQKEQADVGNTADGNEDDRIRRICTSISKVLRNTSGSIAECGELFKQVYDELPWARGAMDQVHAADKCSNPLLRGSAKRHFVEVHGRGFNLEWANNEVRLRNAPGSKQEAGAMELQIERPMKAEKEKDKQNRDGRKETKAGKGESSQCASRAQRGVGQERREERAPTRTHQICTCIAAFLRENRDHCGTQTRSMECGALFKLVYDELPWAQEEMSGGSSKPKSPAKRHFVEAHGKEFGLEWMANDNRVRLTTSKTLVDAGAGTGAAGAVGVSAAGAASSDTSQNKTNKKQQQQQQQAKQQQQQQDTQQPRQPALELKATNELAKGAQRPGGRPPDKCMCRVEVQMPDQCKHTRSVQLACTVNELCQQLATKVQQQAGSEGSQVQGALELALRRADGEVRVMDNAHTLRQAGVEKGGVVIVRWTGGADGGVAAPQPNLGPKKGTVRTERQTIARIETTDGSGAGAGASGRGKQQDLKVAGDFTDGFVFMSSSATCNECLAKSLFGSPKGQLAKMKRHILPSTALFLVNFETHELHGVFRADGEPSLDIIPTAWATTGRGNKFPAQVKVTRNNKQNQKLKVKISAAAHKSSQGFAAPGYHDREGTAQILRQLGYCCD